MALTHVCTLLSAREDATAIEKISKRLGCDWIWTPIDGGHSDILAAMDWAAVLTKVYAPLAHIDQPRIYLHCSAGIHRTGFVAYMLLRTSGLPADEARHALAQIRAVTAQQVGDDRLALAESLLAKLE